MREQYPVGARWTATGPGGERGEVVFAWRDHGRELWRYSWCFSDGSGGGSENATSRRSAVAFCRLEMNILRFPRKMTKIRFVRDTDAEV